jgi:hypothetical protein
MKFFEMFDSATRLRLGFEQPDLWILEGMDSKITAMGAGTRWRGAILLGGLFRYSLAGLLSLFLFLLPSIIMRP